MKTLSLVLLCGAALLGAACSTVQKSDVALLQGRWDGQLLLGDPNHRCSFVISGSNYEFRDETDTNLWCRGTFSLQQNTMPRQYVGVITACSYPEYVGESTVAIYRLEGDTLTITGNEPGNPEAPVRFDALDATCLQLKRKGR